MREPIEQPRPYGRAAMGPAFADLPREHGFEALEVEGTIPSGLRGTLLRNGPALFASHGSPYRHWFDGDGAITAVRLGDDDVRGACRVTVGPELAAERAAGRRLFATGFTRAPSWWRGVGAKAKNTVNINVLAWRDRLFALTEMAPPVEISPDDLATIGPWQLDGVMRQGLNAHYRVDPDTHTTYAFGLKLGIGASIELYELPRAGAARHLVSVPVPDQRIMVHDFCMTARYFVFIVPPLMLKLAPALLNLCAPAEAMSWRPERASVVLMIERAAPHRVRRIDMPSFFQFHFANAFDLPDGAIAVDLCRYDAYAASDAMLLENLRAGRGWDKTGIARLERLTIDAAGTTAFRRLSDVVCDFPQTAPARQSKEYRYAYLMTTHGERDTIGRLDVTSGELIEPTLPDGWFPGEPTFVPRSSAEDDGWVLSLVYDATRHRSGLTVLDAARLASGSVCTAWFDHHVPFPLHGTWIDQAR